MDKNSYKHIFLFLIFLVFSVILPINEAVACPYCGVAMGGSEEAGGSILRNFAILAGVLVSFLSVGAFVLLYVFDIVRKEERRNREYTSQISSEEHTK